MFSELFAFIKCAEMGNLLPLDGSKKQQIEGKVLAYCFERTGKLLSNSREVSPLTDALESILDCIGVDYWCGLH